MKFYSCSELKAQDSIGTCGFS